jgi:uncharacterized phage protein (TIGR01671 family)
MSDRIIKFRAWDRESKKMLMDVWVNNFAVSPDFISLSNEDYIPMQFTGLRDKNGKQIYEGDIVADEEGKRGVVEYEAPEFIAMDTHGSKDDCAGCLNVMVFPNSCEVIGNIYENPELLKA